MAAAGLGPGGLVRQVHAVRGVSFACYRGEAVGLIGSNGSGKSTLLRAVAGLLPPERGAVYTAGQPSLLGVNAALTADLTGEKNIILGALRTYSSGMSARLRFSIAAAKDYDVLLIDEALATGDRTFQRQSE